MLDLRTGLSLLPYNTFGMDVSAQYFSELKEEEDLPLLASAEAYKRGIFILGGGSNILFTGNVPHWVVHNKIKGISKIKEDEDHAWITAGSGQVWHDFVLYCVRNHYSGIENLSLIPGTVGAAPIQNIGAYGAEVKDVIEQVRFYHFETGRFECLSKDACNFGYRNSIFKQELKGKIMITAVTFRLNKKPEFNIEYGSIREELANMDAKELSIKNISDAVIRIRSAKLPNPMEIGNAGSFFKNPEVPTPFFEQLRSATPALPGYKISGELTKIPAAWLIEQCGWKGFTKDNYGVHKHQALVLVNYGKASGSDIYTLSEQILQSVKERFGIELQREVQVV